jgi:hypothetical protein
MTAERRGVRLNKPQDVRRLLQRVINQLMDDREMTNDKARVIATLSNTILKSMELGELEERLTAIEEKVKERGEQHVN